MAVADAVADDMKDFDYRECWVEMQVAQGCNWYEAERNARVKEVEDALDDCDPVWRLTGPNDQHFFFEYLESRPAYYGA
jgi:hypothetical protein